MINADQKPTLAFTCPDWCTVNHVQDGYLKHGHVVHRTTDVTAHGHTIEYWQGTVHLYRERVEPIEVHLSESSTRFDHPKHLRVYALDLLDVADKLNKFNRSTPKS
jgi:hypothetical protein